MSNPLLLAASRSALLEQVVTRLPVSRSVVSRFVPGESVEDALSAAGALVGSGRLVTLDRLGEDLSSFDEVPGVVGEYVSLLAGLSDAGLASSAEISVKPSAFGAALPGGSSVVFDSLLEVCAAADRAGVLVTFDMESSASVDRTFDLLSGVRSQFPSVGVALQAMLRRSFGDARRLAASGVRVRLVKGAYAESSQVAFRSRVEVDAAYRQCLRVLFEEGAYPMVGTHDPALVEYALQLSERFPVPFEFQMLYGIRSEEQLRLAREYPLRVYVPYGADWYGYFLRRLAERPQNLLFFLRSFAPSARS